MNNMWPAVWHQTQESKSIRATCSSRHAWSSLASLFLVGILSAPSTQAGVIVSLLQNPTTTAGGGATSTRSGNGTWQLYAIDDSNSDFGISSYNITLAGATAINHRAPVTTINDQNGDPQTAGFNLLRTGTNANPIQASQNLPGQTPFLITGFGQTASNFATKAQAIDPASAVVGPTTSGSWGNYNSPLLSASSINGNKWVFLAEGLGSSVRVSSATFTVFSNASGASVNVPTQIWEDSYPTIVIADNVNAGDPGVVTRDLSYLYPDSPPEQFNFLNYRSPTGVVTRPTLAHPATFDFATREFRWNTNGAMIGEYSWHTATIDDNTGNWNPHWDIIVRVTAVPEPATLTTVTFAIASVLMLRRHSPTSRRNGSSNS